ncbi:MAG: dihydrodipicolinate synthase family protein [Opitutaceae bacterium]|nr:dihydrodipicolinate synthase family protein [Cephaloticoccus sp.]MCP5530412.1 dihydrodipicolinate synthase family protein [Opitutaceae bacterium]
MSCRIPLKGIFSAQWLPVDEQGVLNVPSLRAIIGMQREAGIHGILTLGSTGYFPLFSLDERKELMEQTVELGGGLPVIANISDIDERNVIALGRHAKKAGLQMVAVMAPMFYPLSQADLLAYFLHVVEEVELPLLLYNFPERSGIKIEINTIERFAQRAPLAGVKQSGADFLYHHDLVKLGERWDFAVLTGEDTQLKAVAELGGQGCIGGLSNIVPELLVRAYGQYWLGESLEVGEVSPTERLSEVGAMFNRLEFPLNVAAGIEARGFDPGSWRRTVSPVSKTLYRELVDDLRDKFTAWKLPMGDKAS